MNLNLDLSAAPRRAQLAVEDHHWWWRALFCGGSTGFFVYGYCFYYFYARSDMNGFMQTSFYFGYMFMICYGFFLMLGTVGARPAARPACGGLRAALMRASVWFGDCAQATGRAWRLCATFTRQSSASDEELLVVKKKRISSPASWIRNGSQCGLSAVPAARQPPPPRTTGRAIK